MASTSALPVTSPHGGATRRKRGETDSTATSLDDDESEIDSMRPVVPTPRRKRRKKLTDAMSSMNLHKESDGEDEDADSSQAVADDDEEADAYTASSLEDDDDFSQADDDDDAPTSEPMVDGDREAHRKIMFELVFGPEPPTSIVEARLEDMIRTSLQHATLASAKTQDDMSMDACYYCRPSFPMPLYPLRTRSSSFPNMTALQDPPDDMDIDD